MIGYKIVEYKDGQIKALFHGTQGSRTFPINQWIKADQKFVTDGSHGKEYLSGFHFLKSKQEAEEFFSKKFKIKKNRRVVACEVRGNIRLKPTGTCWLADEIRLTAV